MSSTTWQLQDPASGFRYEQTEGVQQKFAARMFSAERMGLAAGTTALQTGILKVVPDSSSCQKTPAWQKKTILLDILGDDCII
jgi:hypothetical protein